jgi:predicted phosphoadenosine phosphosulfate sulfurtransferase
MRRPIGVDVYTAARARIAWVFDTFPRVCVSFSGGKDSTVLLHLAAEEARRRRRTIGLLFIDWEAQFQLTIDHVARCFGDYADCTEPFWVALPLRTVNGCSQIEPEWECWDAKKRDLWVRQPPPTAITDPAALPPYTPRMTFEEFAPAFHLWYAQGQLCCSLVGLRAQESLRRLLAVTRQGKVCLGGKKWTAWVGKSAWNAYPLYDWKADDVWTYTARERKPYNAIYDRMHQAGLTPNQMRVDEPYGDEARRGLWLAHALEPETWGRLVARVAGANQGGLYAGKGNLGDGAIRKPDHLSWKAYAELLLETMPPQHAEHYRAKIAVWQRWYAVHRTMHPQQFPDSLPGDLSGPDQPSWRRVCKVLLKNDYWCKGLGFSPTRTAAYERYRASLKKKMTLWYGAHDVA